MDRKTKVILEKSYRKGLKSGAKKGRSARKVLTTVSDFIWIILIWRTFYRLVGLLCGFVNGRAWSK
jgi:hypothetical protein